VPAPHPHLDAVAGIRTDLDAFNDVEIAALIYQGYRQADAFVPISLVEGPRPLPDPPALALTPGTCKILEAGSQSIFRSLQPAFCRPQIAWILRVTALFGSLALASAIAALALGQTTAGLFDAIRACLEQLLVCTTPLVWPFAYRDHLTPWVGLPLELVVLVAIVYAFCRWTGPKAWLYWRNLLWFVNLLILPLAALLIALVAWLMFLANRRFIVPKAG
jgi:hypothetical protein